MNYASAKVPNYKHPSLASALQGSHTAHSHKHRGVDATQHRVGRVPWRGIPALLTDTFADRPQADELPERVAKGLVDDAVEDEVEGEVEDLHEVGEVQGDVHLVAVHGRAGVLQAELEQLPRGHQNEEGQHHRHQCRRHAVEGVVREPTLAAHRPAKHQ